MPIVNEIKGNICKIVRQENEYTAMVHGANCFCVMGAGLALEVKKSFKAAFLIDRATIKGDKRKLGNMTVAQFKADDGSIKSVINGYTQYHLGRNGKYNAVRLVFKRINAKFAGQHVLSPLIGCGIAGLNWELVRRIIEDATPDVKITIVHFNG